MLNWICNLIYNYVQDKINVTLNNMEVFIPELWNFILALNDRIDDIVQSLYKIGGPMAVFILLIFWRPILYGFIRLINEAIKFRP